MELTREQIVAMAAAIRLEIAPADVENVRLRLTAMLTAMEGIEAHLGAQMDAVDPVPPLQWNENG